MIAAIIIIGAVAFALAYRSYGRFLVRLFDLRAERRTPAHELRDGIDYAPAKPPVLLGHHFSSIAGAGPIVGPIFATLVFGWVPAVVWIVLGSIFIGGVHDLGSLAVSIKHRAQSIAQVAREQLTPLAGKLFLTFVWLALVYVLVVFLDLTASTFAPQLPASLSAERAAALARRGGGVATASILFVVLALALGQLLQRTRVSLRVASSIFVPLMFASVIAGHALPLLPPSWLAVGGSPATGWTLVLLAYCFAASVAPVWVLLQPRDYLSAFLLYASLGGGVVGMLLSGFSNDPALALSYPAFLGFHSAKLGYLFPALFITIACGACSGFHSVVASGTTAKQLDRELDARPIGYGAMLIEGMLALVAVATVAVLHAGSPETHLAPPAIFASGLSRFLALLGVPPDAGQTFGMLALSTFLLTTLDTGTRLGRYVLGELTGARGRRGGWLLTAATLALPLAFSLTTFRDASGAVVPVWRVIWPVFGATNQLLGALALLVISVWLRRNGRPAWFTLLPMAFMTSATLLALAQLVLSYGASLIGIIAAVLFVLAVILLVEALRSRPARSSAARGAESGNAGLAARVDAPYTHIDGR